MASPTQSRIELIVEAVKAINPLRQTRKETDQLQNSVKNAQNNIRGLNNTLDKTAATTQRAASGMSSLGRAIRSLAIAEFVRQSVVTAATLNDLDLQLSLITKKYGDYDRMIKVATEAQKLFGLSQRESLGDINTIYARLRPLGIAVEDIRSTYVGFNTVAKLSGASSMEASAAFRQLAQAMGRGTLQGDEFISMSENIPGILGAVALELNVEVGQLKELSKQGAITTDVLLRALKRLEKEGAGAIDEIAKKSDIGRFKEFSNAVEKLAQAIGNTLLPALRPTVTFLTDLIKVVAALPQPIKDFGATIGIAAFAFDALRKSILAVYALRLADWLRTQAALMQFFGGRIYFASAATTVMGNAVKLLGFALNALPWAILATAIGIYIKDVYDAKAATEQFNAAIASGSLDQLNAALAAETHTQSLIRQRIQKAQLSPRGDRGGGFALIAAQKDLEASNARVLKLRDAMGIAAEKEEQAYQQQNKTQQKIGKETKGRKDITAEQLRLEEQLFVARTKGDQLEQAYIEKLIRRQDILASEMKPREQIKAFLENEIQYSERVKQIRKDIADIMAGAAISFGETVFDGSEMGGMFTGLGETAKQSKELKDKLTELISPLNTINSVSAAIGESFASAIQGMIEGTASAQQTLANFFRSIADSFMEMATEIIKAAIRMMAFNVISSIFSGGSQFAASKMAMPSGFSPLAKPGILPGLSFGLYGEGTLYGGPKAKGGPVSAGSAYLVGEKGPELFMPGASGNIVPNKALSGSNIIVNVDASGSNVQGNQPDAAQLGRAIGAAVQAELIKQKRPGGLLA